MSKTVRAYCIRPLTVAIMLIAFAAAMAQELPIVAVGAIFYISIYDYSHC